MVAVPPGLQCSHQEGQQQPRSQDAENPGKAVQMQGPALRLGVCVTLQVTSAFFRPPFLLQDVQVTFFLKLQNPVETKYEVVVTTQVAPEDIINTRLIKLLRRAKTD